MLPSTFKFVIAMIACVINERMQRKLDYTHEEVRALKEVRAFTGAGPIFFAMLRTTTFPPNVCATATRH